MLGDLLIERLLLLIGVDHLVLVARHGVGVGCVGGGLHVRVLLSERGADGV